MDRRHEIIGEARETLRRVDARLAASGAPRVASLVEPVFSDPVTKWREEMTALELAREAERERTGLAQRIYESTMKTQLDTAEGLAAVGQLVEALAERIERLEDETSELRTKLQIANVRIDDLLKARASTVEDRGKVLDLPNPIARRA
jgi:hypothetical protein